MGKIKETLEESERLIKQHLSNEEKLEASKAITTFLEFLHKNVNLAVYDDNFCDCIDSVEEHFGIETFCHKCFKSDVEMLEEPLDCCMGWMCKDCWSDKLIRCPLCKEKINK